MRTEVLKYSAICSSILFALSVNAATEEGLNGHGYLNYGMGVSNDPVLNKKAYEWAGTGANIFKLAGLTHADTSGGRLGNDGNWVQLQADYGKNMNDMNWGTHVMFSTNGYSDNFVPEWLYVDAVGVLSSNPEAVIWAGQKYVSRVSTPLVVNEALASDGRGFGIENLDSDFGKFAFSVTRNLYNSYEKKLHQGDTLLFSSSLSGIEVADKLTADLFANYGTYMGPNRDEEKAGGKTYGDYAPDSHQIAIRLNQGDSDSSHQFFLRYSGNSRQVATREWWQPVPSSLLGGFFYGKYQFTDAFRTEYTYAHESERYSERARNTQHGYRQPVEFKASDWDSLILRNSYTWNDKTSTVLEVGVERLEFDAVDTSESGTNSGSKISLAQNIHIGSGLWDRPVISFYVTYSEMDVNTKVYDKPWGADSDITLGRRDALSFGVMFESWF